MRVPEAWRYHGEKLTIFLLLCERYVEDDDVFYYLAA